MGKVGIAQFTKIGVGQGKNRLDLIDGEIVDRRNVPEVLHQSWAYRRVGSGSKAFPVERRQNLYISWALGRVLVPGGTASTQKRPTKPCKFCAIITEAEPSFRVYRD